LNDQHVLKSKGIELNILFPGDYGHYFLVIVATISWLLWPLFPGDCGYYFLVIMATISWSLWSLFPGDCGHYFLVIVAMLLKATRLGGPPSS